MLTLIPIGGLANRLRTIASAVALARQTHHDLFIIWYKDTGLNCRFDQLLQPFAQSDIQLKEATLADLLVYDRPRKKNLWLPGLFQRFLFDGRLYDPAPELAPGSLFDFVRWARNFRRAYLATCYPFFPANPALYGQLFLPAPCVEERIQTFTERFSTHTVGVHIRRTDNARAIARSPLSLFIKEMEREVEAHPDTLFFVASDSEQDKQALKERFGSRIITSDRPADRNSLQGMQEGAADFFTLSRTCKILGSCYSSFSEISALIHQIPYHSTQ